MTTPHGHPDYQDIVNTSTPNLFPALTQTIPAGNTVFPVTPVASWGSLQLNVGPQAGQGSARIEHFTDAAGLNSVGFDQWSVIPSCGLIVRSPLRATYVQLSLFASLGVPMTLQSYASMQSTTADKLSFPVGYQSAKFQNTSVPANTLINVRPSHIAAGEAWLYVHPHDAAGKLTVSIQTEDSTGAQVELLYLNGSFAADITQRLLIPDRIVDVLVQNNDVAAPHSLDLTLIIPPQ